MPRWLRTVRILVICLSTVAAAGRDLTASARYYCGATDTTGLPNVRYVAPTGADNDTCGASLQTPCATIQQGIIRCTGEHCAVLVANARYTLPTTLLLTGAVAVYGGCEMLEGPRPELRSLVFGPNGAPAVIALRITAPTLFQGFFVFAGDGVSSGDTSSIAFASLLSSGVMLESVTLTAGKAANSTRVGGEGKRAPRSDNGQDSGGGRSPGPADGGDGGAPLTDGKAGEAGHTGVRARGGIASRRNGDSGQPGPCRGPGRMSPERNGSISSSFQWVPGVGGAGEKGGFGGGGGGGRGTLNYGGGGAAGGEGGGGGEGGTQGGASIGLLIAGGRLTYNDGTITAGPGGSGSRGGTGAPRGEPGSGTRTKGISGNGGDGGVGGPGTGGAGGNGGPSFAVATAGTGPGDGILIATAVDLSPGTAGGQGAGGNAPDPCPKGEPGQDGVTAAEQRLELKKP